MNEYMTININSVEQKKKEAGIINVLIIYDINSLHTKDSFYIDFLATS